MVQVTRETCIRDGKDMPPQEIVNAITTEAISTELGEKAQKRAIRFYSRVKQLLDENVPLEDIQADKENIYASISEEDW